MVTCFALWCVFCMNVIVSTGALIVCVLKYFSLFRFELQFSHTSDMNSINLLEKE